MTALDTGSAGCAAVDIGTNTANLLITDATGREICRIATATRLGRGIDASGRFAPESVARTLACLSEYRRELDHYSVERVRCVATSASRLSLDFGDFQASARKILGHDVELIDGSQEGRLAFLGATSRVDSHPGSQLVVDIGGGSTELAVGASADPVVRSLEVGAVRLTEKYISSDPPLPEELVNAIADVQDLVADACRENPEFGRSSRVIGCSGTILTIAAVELGSSQVPDGFVLSRAAVEDVFRTLATESLADRVHNPGLESQRADIIVAGCCILVAILRTLEIDSITVSHGNILDGICRELLSTS